MIDIKLITSALELCGKSMEDMDWEYVWSDTEYFSYPRFFYYILSPEFIEKYRKVYDDYDDIFHIPMVYTPKEWDKATLWTACTVWWAIYEYQSWNSEPIISLLSKIWHQNK